MRIVIADDEGRDAEVELHNDAWAYYSQGESTGFIEWEDIPQKTRELLLKLKGQVDKAAGEILALLCAVKVEDEREAEEAA